MTFTENEIQILQRVHYLVTLNCRQQIFLLELASMFQISERTLTKRFKQMYHKTIYHHRLENCMQRAKEMLESGESIKAVALAMGYKTSGNFSRAYKKIFFVLPSTHQPH